MIIKRCQGHFDPSIFRDSYQEALRELIEAKMRGLLVKPKPAGNRARLWISWRR
jgi:non-homologous end joining protein Ku